MLPSRPFPALRGLSLLQLIGVAQENGDDPVVSSFSVEALWSAAEGPSAEGPAVDHPTELKAVLRSRFFRQLGPLRSVTATYRHARWRE